MLAGLRTKTSSAAAKLFFKRNPCIVFHSQIISRVWSVVGKKRKHLFSKRPWKVERWIFSPLLLFFLFVCSLLNINRLLCSCLASPPTSTSVADLTHVRMHAQFSSTFLFLSFPFLLPEVKTGSLFFVWKSVPVVDSSEIGAARSPIPHYDVKMFEKWIDCNLIS